MPTHYEAFGGLIEHGVEATLKVASILNGYRDARCYLAN
jgi:hypothetical protein